MTLALDVPTTFPSVPVPLPVETPRHAMVAALRDYLAGLVFQRPGPGGSTFQVPRKNILTEWPDPEKKLPYPSIAVLPGVGVHETLGLTPVVQEDTFDVYAPGTALVQLAEYAETLQLTVWAADPVERRSLAAGIMAALTPSDAVYGIRLRTSPDYFGRVCTMQLLREELIDGEETVRNVRRWDCYLDARIPVVKLMPFRLMQPVLELYVEEAVQAAVLTEDGAVIVVTCTPIGGAGR